MSTEQKLNFQINEISSKQEIIYIKDYKIIKRVGFGSSGLVYKVVKKNDPTNKIYILKQIPYSEPNLEETNKKVQSAQNEALILSKLSCKYIVKYYNSFIDDEYNLNIIMEYCDSGDLNSFISNLKKENKYLTEEEIWRFFIQISLGLAYIHSKNILHRDLKPMNIFLSNKNQVKIGDLGVAKLLSTNANANTCIGTPYYLSPEICQEKPYNSKGDVWALGCILYELCTFNKPFIASNPAALILKIINGKYTPLNEIKNGPKYSEELQYMIDNTLQKDYLVRPLMIEIINSDIFIEKAILFGFEDDLREIKSKYENIKTMNDMSEHLYDRLNENKLNEKEVINSNTYSGKKEVNINKNNNLGHNSNMNDIHPICFMKTKNNYLSTGRSTNDSSHNYEKNNNLYNTNIIFKQNENIYSNNNKNSKPTTKYIKYIIKDKNKNKNKNNSNNKKKQISNRINIKNIKSKEKNDIELKQNKSNSKIKILHISPMHYRDSSGGRYDHKNISIINKATYFELSSKNKINNSKEKKYIHKTKNIMNKASFQNKNNNYKGITQNKQILEKNSINLNKFLNKNINNENLDENKYKFNTSKNMISNSNEKLNEKNKINFKYANCYDKNNLNQLNNININYSLNLIEKTRFNFYNKNFQNIQEPVEVMKTQTQNNFNNINNFRIERGLDNTKKEKTFTIFKPHQNLNDNKSRDSSEEHDNNNIINYEDNEIIEDSGLEDEDDEEKVSIVREKKAPIQKDKIDQKKDEYYQKYHECKNKIMQYKNIIDIHKLFSLYEKMSTDKTKTEEYLNEIEDYIKNNLSKDLYEKFRKLFKLFVYYDIKLQEFTNL